MDWWGWTPDIAVRVAQLVVTVIGLIAVFWTLNVNRKTLRNSQRTLQQKTESDDRDTWWRRFEWAYGLIGSEDPSDRVNGIRLMYLLEESPLITDSERDVIRTIGLTGVEEDLGIPATMEEAEPLDSHLALEQKEGEFYDSDASNEPEGSSDGQQGKYRQDPQDRQI